MPNKKIYWQIFPAYITVIIIAIAAVLFFSSREIRKQTIEEKQNDLEIAARVIAERVSLIENDDIDKYCDQIGKQTNVRITIISLKGKVLGDSEKQPAAMDTHIDRQEFQDALQSGIGKSVRFSDTVKRYMFYVAVPIRDKNGDIEAVARVSVSNSSVNKIIDKVNDKILLIGLLTAAAAATAAAIFSHKISKPLVKLRKGAEKFKSGNLKHRLELGGNRETAALAGAMNAMADQIESNISDITAKLVRQKAILSSMTEAVIAVDNAKTLIMANEAAVKLFGITDNAIGRQLEQVARNPELHKIVDEMLTDGGEMLDKEITVFQGSSPQILLVHATVLSSGKDNIGVLVVLNNVTQIKKLENVRKEFVANVSHELKTPITSIKGFVETLNDGAVEDPEKAKKFLDIIARQSSRLESIIEDLLALSRIEQLKDDSQIELEYKPLKPALTGAVSVCQKKAEAKGIEIICNCEEDLKAKINPNLLEQAVVNLIDNAVKYSDESSKNIEVSAVKDDKDTVIAVKDYGCGIAQEDIPRLFERFYRVDKARSRRLGGTGLGLSIVKHIANAHNGSVEVQSRQGEGSIFSIRI